MNLQELLGLNAPRQQAQQDNSSLGMLMQFIQQGNQREQAPLPAPNLPDLSNSPAMQYAAQRQDEAEKLKARREQLLSDARELSGKGAAISTDPQVQALIDSGNPQQVALGMKLAEEFKTKQIAGQFDEKISYKDWLNGTPESRASMSEFMKLNHPGTNINVGERGADSIVWMSDDQKRQAGLDISQPYAINQKSGMPEAVKPNEYTDAQNMATGYHDRMVASEKLLDAEMEAGFQTGKPKEALANALPWGLGGLLRDPQMQRVRQAQEDWVRAKLRKESGAAIPPDEMEREVQTYFPGLNEKDPSIIAQKRQARHQAVQQLFESTGGKTLNRNLERRQQSTTGRGPRPQAAQPADISNLMQDLQAQGKDGLYHAPEGATDEQLIKQLVAKDPGSTGIVNGQTILPQVSTGPNANDAATPGTKAYIAKQRADIKQRALDASSKNSPANKAAQKQAEEDAAILKLYGL